MDLVQFDEKRLVDSLVNNQLRQRMLFRSMSVTQANLLIVLHVVANGGAVEVTLKVLEAHPKDPVKVVVHAQLFTQVALVLVRLLLPLVLPLALRARPVRVPNLQQPDKLIVLTDDCQGMQDSVGVMVGQAFRFYLLLLAKSD